IEGVSAAYQNARNAGAEASVSTFEGINEGSPQWQKDLEKQVTDMFAPIVEDYMKLSDVETWEKSTPTYDQAAESLNQYRLGVVVKSLANFTIHAIIESGTLGQVEAARDFDSMVVGKLGIDRLAERATMLPFEAGIIRQAEYFYNAKHPTLIPTPSQLIDMVVKEVIPLDEFKQWMKFQGFDEIQSQRIWDSHFIAPDWGQILNAYYRGEITRAQVEELKILVDLDPKYNVIWDALIEVIPAVSELVNQRTKEVITQKEFEKNLQWHGFDKIWAGRIWDAHFQPPDLGDILTSWRRG
ncbi:unnamed protein product, partial [marine sediment metagenome]